MDSRIGHFQIGEVLGRGGMGVVYRATDLVLEREVALKTMLPDVVSTRSRRARFLREARAAAAISHPNVATVYEVGEEGDVVYIAMEYIDGDTLQDLLANEPFPLSRGLEIAKDIARALEAAHDAGVVHRDLKPANVMVDASGRVRLLDFGLAKTERPRLNGDTDLLTADSAILGTPAYMSPEQCRGRPADARSDVFSFGTLLYELLAGERPFSGDSDPELGMAIMTSDPEPLESVDPNIPPELARVVARCLEKEPADRYQDGAELAAAMEAVRLGANETATLSRARPTHAAITQSAETRSSSRTWLLVAAALLAIAAGSWLAVRENAVTRKPAVRAVRSASETAASRPRPAIPRDVQLTAFPATKRIYNHAGAREDGTFAYATFEGLWLASTHGGPPRKVDVHGAFESAWPYDFFPDGKRLLVTSRRGSEGILGIVDLRSGEGTIVLTGKGESARLSPDGTRVVVKTERGLEVVGVDGEGQTLVAPFAADEHCLVQTWSPDGRHIAFIRDRWSEYGWKTTLEITAANGSALTTIPTVGHLNQNGVHGAAWIRPDLIVYGTAAVEGTGSELWSIGVKGGAWDGRPGELLYAWPDASVDWLRPFGSKLLYVKNARMETDVWVAELEGDQLRTAPVRLTQHERQDILSGWTSDDRALFASDRFGSWDVFAQSVGGSPEAVASGPDDESGAMQVGSSIFFWRVRRPTADEAPRCALVRLDEDGHETELLTLARAATPEPGPPVCASVGCALHDPGRCVLEEPQHEGDVVSLFDPREPVLRRRPTPLKHGGSLSPDGRTLAELSSDGAAVFVLLTELETGKVSEVRIRDSLDHVTGLTWWPNRPGWLLTARSGEHGLLVSVAPDGTTKTLWSKPGRWPLYAEVSPSGRYVGFVDRNATCNIWMLEGLDL